MSDDKELDEILDEFSTLRKNSNEESAASQTEESSVAENDFKEIIEIESEHIDESDSSGQEFYITEEEPEKNITDKDEKEFGFEEVPALESEDDLAPSGTDEEDTLPETDSEDEMVNIDDVAKAVDKEENKGRKKSIVAIVVALVVAIAVCVGVYFGFFYHPAEPAKEVKTTVDSQGNIVEIVEDEVTGEVNPLTGEAGYNAGALNKRPVAVVVENEYSTSAVRPQWGLSDADIVLEGESEFSTRLLLFWADYTKMPSQIGPTRSARPPFIRFSQLFDSIFIHAGLSHTRGAYYGADSLFRDQNIDHVNLLSGDGYGCFARDNSRHTAVEHTGYLKGDQTAQLISKTGFRTELNANRFTTLSFYDEETNLSENPANTIEFRWNTKGNCPKKGTYTYDAESKCYTTTDFDSGYGKSNVSWKNLVFLLDTTEYVVKKNYKGKGNSETYCDYKLSGGKGTVVSNGTYIDITWGVENGKLWLKDTNGNEVKLNAGKTYIGYGSQNYGGYAKVID